MANYDFSTLNSSDLEELVCDLLNLAQPEGSIIKYKTFKDGKDKGIDFIYSTAKNLYAQVGQVKHYYRTGYDGLYKVLKDTEVNNVNILKPNKYIVATSVDLNVANTEAIKKLFGVYIKNLNDIYGKKDLNRLIEENEGILNSHYKLWLSDFSILTKILNSHLQFRSSDLINDELKKRIRIYVKTSLFEDTRKALEKNKFVVITGEPGVGKTTLAEMLIYEYIANEYNLTYIIDDIREAEQVLVPDNSKQIIYFDDFLGSTEVEINKAKGSESRLINLLRRVAKYENKFVVLTTRNHLLNGAIISSEKLDRFNIKTKTSLLELKEYNVELKKQLLNNHIEVSDLREDLKDVLLNNDIQNFISNHNNFTPRTVEFICDSIKINHYEPEAFKSFIKTSFNKPEIIWTHAYTVQINEDARLLLHTLLSFGQSANIHELEEAFLTRVQYEVEKNNKKIEMYAFRNAFRNLDGSFIIIKNTCEVHFINPSIIDFLKSFIRKDKVEIKKIAESVKYVSQLTERLFSLGSAGINKMPESLEKRLLTDYHSFVSNSNSDYDLIQLALVIYKYIDNVDKEEVICEIIDSITEWEALYQDYSLNSHFKEFMVSVKDNENINSVLQERIEEIVSELFRGQTDINEAIDLLAELIKSFDIDFNKLDTTNIINHLDDLFSENVFDETEDLKDWITDEGEAYDKRREFEDFNERLNLLGLEYKADLSEFDIDWYEIARDNDFRRMMEKDD
ncbi:AAA family ATPase [Flavobacterium limnophilum]|uniref:nSTAND3 domain-containing NTPase n=1 Tax=Flavobacterium limnophilum TaxID=3003262 RepID=UPI002482A5AB|nr:AAA family ATPase [Flavobacterium limnophilum]